nr:retrotransposon protein, putative, Ty1-copia subclass [Tanacetum cinerariifolium]
VFGDFRLLKQRLQLRIRTDNGTEFVNQTLRDYYEEVGISHETYVSRSPQQNGVVERRNRTLIEATRTIDDALFSTIKVVLRHQTTQQYGAILPIELTTDEIKNSKAYKEYYACAMGEATPKPKASARKKKGEYASSTTPPTPTPITTVESAPRLSATTKAESAPRLSAFAKGEGTDSKPGVPDVPSDDSEEELSWKSSDDEETKEMGTGGDEVRESGGESEEKKETSEEEEVSIDPIPRTPKDSEKESDDEEEQESRLREEARIPEEEDAEELYRDVNINQGRGLQ